jgi:uncharacterized membrane protein
VAALNAAYDEAATPPEVLEYTLMEKFGWTQQQFDRQDFARLWRAMTAASVYQAAIKTQRREALGRDEQRLFNVALQLDYENSQ